jgi:hypothetical protein
MEWNISLRPVISSMGRFAAITFSASFFSLFMAAAAHQQDSSSK